MKKSKNNNIILGFGYWVFEFGFSWCKGKVINVARFVWESPQFCEFEVAEMCCAADFKCCHVFMGCS